MRVQHNIVAMNSYRNYNNNTKGINKNLEKLSSGYKINRAGDDAAGLAISEKMRAQITGLEGAQKNAKDGISLVQTAEGALTEVHSMLNRMYSLAEQSANGTYDSSTDRFQLQKEVEQLSKEIDRIADSSNFNGLKLLDGSMSASGATSTSAVAADVSKMGLDIVGDAEELNAVKGVYTVTATSTSGFANLGTNKLELTLNYEQDGQELTKTVKLFTGGTDGKSIYIDDGSEDGIKLNAQATTANTIELKTDATAIKEAFRKVDPNFSELFNIEAGANAGELKFTARTAGTAGAVLKGVEINSVANATGVKTADKAQVAETTKALDVNKAYNLSKAKIWNNTPSATDSATISTKLEDAIFEVNGEKFVFIDKSVTIDDALKAKLAESGVGNNYYQTKQTGTIGDDDGAGMAQKIASATGLKVEVGTVGSGAFTTATKGTKIRFMPSETTTKNSGAGGLTLQIGDTAEEWNQLKVEIDDVHVKALKIHDVDISQQGGAQKAMDSLKDAINKVSDVRGTLGATQNRLEHTINNLSVMQENIQDAESTIRDTDVADEMMKYTKNSILVQSAQAMLAQANQQPQGVLQLLQ